MVGPHTATQLCGYYLTPDECLISTVAITEARWRLHCVMNHPSMTGARPPLISRCCCCCGGGAGSVRFVGTLDALLEHLPELCRVQAPRYPHALLPSRKQRCDGPAQLRPAVEGVVVGALGDDPDGEALALVRVVRGRVWVALVKCNLPLGARQHGGDGQRVVQRRALDDAEYVPVESRKRSLASTNFRGWVGFILTCKSLRRT